MMEFLIEHDGKIFSLPGAITKIDVNYSLNDGCGKLQFEYVSADFEASCGDLVRFRNDGNVFFGKVFKVSGRKDGAISVTAYDQLRFCKTKDTIAVSGDTASSIVKRMCNNLQLTTGTIAETGYILATDIQDSKTWLDIVYSAISDTLVGTGKKYRLADEFGQITLKDLANLQLNLILGDDSGCYNYDYSKSIDDGFYNQVKLASDNETSNKRDVYVANDSKSIGKYGLLQYFEVLDKNANAAQAKSKVDALLRLYNAEVQTLKLSCIGDNRIREGVSFYGRLADIDLNKRLIVKSVKHSYLPVHTMELEVYV